MIAAAQAEFTFERRAADARRARPSQCDLILAELQRRAGQWVPMPELAAVARAYAVHSRVSDLRAAGHVIEHRNHWSQDGVCCSEYRLATGGVRVNPRPSAESAESAESADQPLPR